MIISKLTYLKNLRGHKISNGAYRVLVAIFNYTDESGESAHPGEHRIADDTGMSQRSVRAYLKWLYNHGYLTKGARGHGNGGQGAGIATVYALDLPANSCQPTGEISPTIRSFIRS